MSRTIPHDTIAGTVQQAFASVFATTSRAWRRLPTVHKRHVRPDAGCAVVRPAASPVFLVESDIRPGVHGILP